MGLFLSMSGIAGATAQDVENCLLNYAALKSGKLETVDSNPDDDSTLIIAEALESKVTVLYPGEFFQWDEASEYLSRQMKKPVFSLHIHDGDLWMYILFVDGNAVGHFNPIPAYWDDGISDEERQLWAGDASVLCRHWPKVAPDNIRNYLVQWDSDELGLAGLRKAYSTDQFSVGEDWQLCDFMKNLGLKYPIDEQGKRTGKTFRLSIPEA